MAYAERKIMILAPNEVAWLALNIAKLPTEQALIATAICQAESGNSTDAINNRFPPNWDLGLWQISSKWNWDKLIVHRWWDPYDNARMMRKIYDDFLRRPEADGFKAWTVYNSTAYLDYIPAAELGMAHPWQPINPHTTAWRIGA